MEKVITGNLKYLKLQERKANEKLLQYEINTSYTQEIETFEQEFRRLEQEYINETIKFLTIKNEYGINVITGVSSCIYVPHL